MPNETSIGGVCRLSDRGVIRASGSDAAKFLQGQLTNDVLTLTRERARLAGFCSAKGRLQASFLVWRDEGGDYLLSCPLSILATTLKRLSMFVLRAQCRLTDASAEIELVGVAGSAAEAMSGGAEPWTCSARGPASLIRLPDGAGERRCLVAAPAGSEVDVAAAPAMTLATWRWLEVQSGIVTIEAATVDRFVPQMVNFELVGGVDFQKGCYPGQEVVARSQYRGTTKRRTFLFDCDTLPEAGQDVFVGAAAGEAAGTVANAAPRPTHPGGSALVELRLAALDSDDLRLGTPDGPRLHRSDLPYAVPLEVETTH
jgi:tRNA-modifying protein YgfZ